MWAQRAHCDAVNSYEGESALVPLLIRADKFAPHESGVCMEAVSSLCAGVRIGCRPAERQVDLSDNAAEVGNQRRIAPFGMGAGTIGWRKRAVDRAGEVVMDGRTGRRRVRISYGQGDPAAASLSSSARAGVQSPEPRTAPAAPMVP